MTHTKRITKNLSYLFLSEIVTNILGFIITIFIARKIGGYGFGQYSFVFAFASLFLVFADFGLIQFVIREISRNKDKTKELFGNCLALKLIFSLFSFLIFIFAASMVKESQGIMLAMYIGMISILILNIGYFYKTLLQAYEIMQYEAIIRTIEKILIFFIILFVLFKNLGLIALVSTYLIVSIISLIEFFFIVKIKITSIKLKFDLGLWKNILKESFPFWFTGVFIMIYFKIDTVMLSMFKGYTAVGWYNAAYKLIDGLSIIPAMVIAVVFPVMSRLFLEKREHLTNLYKKSFKYLTIIAIPMGIGITLLAHRIIIFLYKEEYVQSALILQVIIWAEVFIFVNYLMGYLLNSVNQQKLFTYSTGACALINILLNLLLIPSLSYIGAGIATVLTEIINFSILFYFTSKHDYKINIIKIIFKPLIAGIVMAIIIYLFKFLNILIIIPLAMIIYFSVLLLLKEIGKEEFDLFLSIFHKEDKIEKD